MGKMSNSEFVATIPIEVSISINDLYINGYRFLAVEDVSNSILLFKKRPLRNIITRQWIPQAGDLPVYLLSFLNWDNNGAISFFSGLYMPEISDMPWNKSLHEIGKIDAEDIYVLIPAEEVAPDKGVHVFGREFAAVGHKRYISAGSLDSNNHLIVFADGRDEWTAYSDKDDIIMYTSLIEWWCADN